MCKYGNVIDRLFYCTIGNVPYVRFGDCHVYQRLYMHRVVCDIDSLWNQADGESQYAAGAEGRARGDFVFKVVLQGAIRHVYGDGCARAFG